MHVANILSYLSQRYGGPPRVAFDLGKAVVEYGVKVSYWASCDASERQELAKHNSSVHLFDTTWPKRWYRAPTLIQALLHELPFIDLLHLHEVWSHTQCASARIARRRGVPYILTTHGVLQPWKMKIRSKRFKKYAYMALCGNRMLDGAACLHAVTPHEVEGIRNLGYKGPITVIPNGVNAHDFVDMPERSEAEARWPQLSGRRVVLFLSRLSREKGLEELLPTWANLVGHGSFDDAILVIAGPDDGRGYGKVVEAMIEQHNLNSHVLLTGLVQGYEKLALMARADIYVLPSFSEGFSMSILENLAASTPVVITPGCNFPEVVDADAGVCVPPAEGPLEEALRTLLDLSDSDRNAMGGRGRKLVEENYTWDIAARRMINVYDCIMRGKEIPRNPAVSP